MREQGVQADCVYCKYIQPELKGKKECPKCNGLTPKFREARMMDKESSQHEILQRILMIEHTEDLNKLKDSFIGLLDAIDIYKFDFKEALINAIRSIEDDQNPI